jgi:AcrR family transcriptional regulator
MARRYDMQRRGRAAADTRARIIDAAHGLLNQRDGTALTLQEVADAAGVSRATVYKSVGCRRDLLTAVFEDQGRLIDYGRVRAAARLKDPAQAVIATVRESARAWSVMPEAIRKTLALAVIDPEVGELVEKYEAYRRAEIAALARRALRAGVTRPGLGMKDAAAVLTVLTGFPAFDHLRHGHEATAATSQLVRLAMASLGINPGEE